MDIDQLIHKTTESHILHKERSDKTQYYLEFDGFYEKISKLLEGKNNGNRILKDIVENKLQIGKSKFDYKQYIQAASEISVVSYFLETFKESFIYEPELNPDSNCNIECQFKDHIYTFNIEVKTPKFEKQEEQEESDSIKICSTGRFENYKEISDELKPFFKNVSGNLFNEEPAIDKKRMDNNAKDFLLSAQQKFPNHCNKNTLNILVICLDSLESMDDWRYYFFDNQGFFTRNSFIQHQEFDHVDLVVLTNLYYKHNNRGNNKNAWNFNNCFNLILRNPFAKIIKNEATIVAYDIIKNYTIECEKYLEANKTFIYPIKHCYYEHICKHFGHGFFEENV